MPGPIYEYISLYQTIEFNSFSSQQPEGKKEMYIISISMFRIFSAELFRVLN